MAEPSFDLDRLRLQAAAHLPPQHFDEFQRLARTLVHGAPFQLLLVDCPSEPLRRQLLAALDPLLGAAKLEAVRLALGRRVTDVADLEALLVKHGRTSDVVHVLGGPAWFDDSRWDAFNARRERVAHGARARLVFWLDEPSIARLARLAPDWWAWRGGVYTFHDAIPASEFSATPLATRRPHVDTRSMRERHQRMATLRAWLDSHPDAPDDMVAPLLHEFGELLFTVGKVDAALAHWRDIELPLYERLGQDRERALTLLRIAIAMHARGEFDQSLHIVCGHVLPMAGQLGDVYVRALALQHVADVLHDSGRLDEALQVRRNELLPLYEKLGDADGRATTLSQIADDLDARGERDEALRIRRDEVLPLYRQLGDLRAQALTLAETADAMLDLGQIDEALRMLREDVLPVFERLGAVYERAFALSKIAKALERRGDAVEAMRILRDQVLPVFEQAGDAKHLHFTRTNLARLLIKRNGPSDAEAASLLAQALADARRIGLPEAGRIEQTMIKAGVPSPSVTDAPGGAGDRIR